MRWTGSRPSTWSGCPAWSERRSIGGAATASGTRTGSGRGDHRLVLDAVGRHPVEVRQHVRYPINTGRVGPHGEDHLAGPATPLQGLPRSRRALHRPDTWNATETP